MYIFVFPFVYHFNCRIGVLVRKVLIEDVAFQLFSLIDLIDLCNLTGLNSLKSGRQIHHTFLPFFLRSGTDTQHRQDPNSAKDKGELF